jgi:NAD(P)-dependent dehydrogenase (short-subunit alcohol dehydrogenase family)
MNILCIGGGEIWEKGIKPYLESLGHAVSTASHRDFNVRNWLNMVYAIQPGDFDWVIYTAGVSRVQSFAQGYENPYSFDMLREEFDVNVIGAFYAAEVMKQNGVKNFIAITSVAGLYGKPNHAGYSASKAALRSLIQSMSFEGFNAYGIAPGRVNTAMRHRDYPNEHVETRLKPEEIGEVVIDIMGGKFESGDNIIIRRIGHETQPLKIDKGEPWKTELKIGLPPAC